jgi:hypothetical protein
MSLKLEVIGAGMGRTGTTSLREALSVLLGGPCFHMLEYKWHPELMAPWTSFLQDFPITADGELPTEIPASRWDVLMPGYVACVDDPAARYWRQLAGLFPDAPVLLSLRDTDSWCASLMHVIEEWEKELAAGGLSEERQAFFDFMSVLYREEMELGAEDFKALYDAHNRSVLDLAEQDEAFKKRLVVWNMGDGWEPICAALDLPVPEIPFPHKNRRGEYHGF